jgi:hypothetical protein
VNGIGSLLLPLHSYQGAVYSLSIYLFNVICSHAQARTFASLFLYFLLSLFLYAHAHLGLGTRISMCCRSSVFCCLYESGGHRTQSTRVNVLLWTPGGLIVCHVSCSHRSRLFLSLSLSFSLSLSSGNLRTRIGQYPPSSAHTLSTAKVTGDSSWLSVSLLYILSVVAYSYWQIPSSFWAHEWDGSGSSRWEQCSLSLSLELSLSLSLSLLNS